MGVSWPHDMATMAGLLRLIISESFKMLQQN
jgi:hypothetical protein